MAGEKDRIEEAAAAQNLPDDDRMWRKLVESGRARAEARSLTEDDVPRLVAEVRRDRRR